MIRADVPQDVTEYKEQFFLGMTGRQLVCVVLMLIDRIYYEKIGRQKEEQRQEIRKGQGRGAA